MVKAIVQGKSRCSIAIVSSAPSNNVSFLTYLEGLARARPFDWTYDLNCWISSNWKTRLHLCTSIPITKKKKENLNVRILLWSSSSFGRKPFYWHDTPKVIKLCLNAFSLPSSKTAVETMTLILPWRKSLIVWSNLARSSPGWKAILRCESAAGCETQ